MNIHSILYVLKSQIARYTYVCLKIMFVIINVGISYVFPSQNEYDTKIIEKYKKWKYVVSHPEDFTSSFSFFYENPDWPMFDKIIPQSEKNIKIIENRNELLKWFEKYYPMTSHGIIVYYKILLKTNPNLAKKYISQTWIYQNLSSKFANDFRKIFDKFISNLDDAKRIKILISKNDIKNLEVMKNTIKNETLIKYVEKYIKNYNNKKMNKLKGIDVDIYDVNDRYNKVNQLISSKKYDIAGQILSRTNDNEEVNPIGFCMIRREVACELMRNGKPLIAYNILNMHKLSRTTTEQRKYYVKIEWLCGFIQYRLLKNNKKAIQHFNNAFESSLDSLHKGKNAFWCGEVCLANNDVILSFNWYKKASENFNTFYGQLAYERLMNLSKNRMLVYNEYYEKAMNSQNISIDSKTNFYNRELVIVLKTISKYKIENSIKYLMCFYKKLIDDIEDPNEELLLLDLASSNAEISFILKEESKKQKFLNNKKNLKQLGENEKNYVMNINDDPCFLSLVHSIISRESNFNPRAKSHVGAVGLMQIMPKTAEHELKNMKIPQLKNKPLYNIEKNITIGSYILNRLNDKYDNNLVYTIAAYNAGEGNVYKFQKQNKKLKSLTNLDIIELIPFKETRVYVKNVLCSLNIYQKIFNAKNCYDCSKLGDMR